MAVAVIEVVEVVDVDLYHADLLVLPLGMAYLAAERLLHIPAVEQVRQRVPDRHVAELLMESKAGDCHGQPLGDRHGELLESGVEIIFHELGTNGR